MSRQQNRAWSRQLSGVVHSATARRWLQDQGSLTARLQQPGPFRLDLLLQKLAPLSVDETHEVGLRTGQLIHTRHVVLYSAGQPVVFAHSVLSPDPAGPLTRWFDRMGNRSLGARLFANPGFRRGRLEYRQIDERHPLYGSAIAALDLSPDSRPRLWARRRFFVFGRQRVLVTEVFSPALLMTFPPAANKSKT